MTTNPKLNLIPKSLHITQTDSDEDVDDDFVDDQVHEELRDVIVEYSTLISPEVTPVITELVDVFPQDVYTITLVKHLIVTCPLLALLCHKKDTRTIKSLWTMEAAPM